MSNKIEVVLNFTMCFDIFSKFEVRQSGPTLKLLFLLNVLEKITSWGILKHFFPRNRNVLQKEMLPLVSNIAKQKVH